MKNETRKFLKACRAVDSGIEKEFFLLSEKEGTSFQELATVLLRGAQKGRANDSINFHDFDQVEKIDRFIKTVNRSRIYFEGISSQYLAFAIQSSDTSQPLSYEDITAKVIAHANFAKDHMLQDSLRIKKLRRGRRPSHVEDLCLAAFAKLFCHILGSKESSFEYAGMIASRYYERRAGIISSSSMRKKLAKFQVKGLKRVKIESNGLWIQDFSRDFFELRYPHKLHIEMNDFETAAAFLKFPLYYRKAPVG